MNRQLDGGTCAQQMLSGAQLVALWMRHSVNLVVALAVLANPASDSTAGGRLLMAALAIWAVARLAVRRLGRWAEAVDYGLVLAVCLAIPWLVSDQHFYLSNCAPVAVAGTAVVGFSLALPSRMSFFAAAGIAAAYAWGSAQVAGWEHVGEIFNLYYFGLQWAAATFVRHGVLRVAASVDRARTLRSIADIREATAHAVKKYDREQLRLLHDTVASTFLVASQASGTPRDRLAVYALRDLQILDEQPALLAPTIDVAAELRELAAYVETPLSLAITEPLVVHGRVGRALVAAAREALNNVDRHANAGTVTVNASPSQIIIRDNGKGYTTDSSTGHGVSASIIDRMRENGGSAKVTSTPGRGTTVELAWDSAGTAIAREELEPDPDRLIDRTRRTYGLALAGYGVLNLVATAYPATTNAHNGHTQTVLVTLALLTALSAVPVIVGGWQRYAGAHLWRLGALILLCIAVVQTVLLPVAELGTQMHWTQSTIGWCLVPLLLSQPLSRSILVAVAWWVIPALCMLARVPTAYFVSNAALGTASILSLQVCALVFNAMIAGAAREADVTFKAYIRQLGQTREAEALEAEYQRRYARLAERIRPLLTALRTTTPFDTQLRQELRAEYQRLRVLFDQSATFDHPLLQALRPTIDSAVDRGVEIAVHTLGRPNPISGTDAQELARPLAWALAQANGWARITLTTDRNELEVSIIFRASLNFSEPTTTNDTIGADKILIRGDTVWLTVHQSGDDDKKGNSVVRQSH
ncbi:sensor histidine kinase [Mycobacteroides saopaulense]|uniref:Histidine kinase/HSP90-like ATPase domain-containing protein n=1 Tax=Mycobacteroides saopaulense TaxID=1578165 RepID=A0ABX3C5P1_9MYCO|nr:ATP-binding protein [Mycobacteroides saopaulense]OHT89059.1 hypothetical protein BKG68_04205 [Mycobacteroides saopaulense]OHU13880.1 hypothetical protein BKG73_04215 [Mycobacteroides saopaulense]